MPNEPPDLYTKKRVFDIGDEVESRNETVLSNRRDFSGKITKINKDSIGHDWFMVTNENGREHDFYEHQLRLKEPILKFTVVDKTPNGDPKFLDVLDEIRENHIKKSSDYGNGEDALANLRAAGRLDIEPWIGVALRMMDKFARVESFIKNKKLVNESIEDAFLDLSSYAALALVLYRESK